MLESAKRGKLKAGKIDLIKHLEGKRLVRSKAIRAKCFDCNGMGEQDECDIEECSLYPYSPYKIAGIRAGVPVGGKNAQFMYPMQRL